MQFNKEKFVKDVKYISKPAMAIIVYMVVCQLLFHKACPSRLLFGIPCPGCGITRAFLLVLLGDFSSATRMHPFWIVIVIGTVVALSERYFVKSEKSYKKLQKINQVVLFIILTASLVFYVYRMIHLYPNHEPMLYESNNLRNIINQFIMNIFK